MRILLTNSPLQFFHTTCFYHPDWGALNLAQLAAMVAGDHEVRLVDNWHFMFKSEGIQEALREFEPQVFGMSNSTCGDTDRILELSAIVRERYPAMIMVAGGQAAAARAEEFLGAGYDFVVDGEGERTFRELVDALAANRQGLSGIDGLIYRDGGGVRRTRRREMIESLDSLPLPARRLQPRLRSKFFPERYSAEIETSRGCPHACDFCAITAFWRRTYRKKSTRAIFDELAHIRHDLGCGQVYFIDDTFGLRVQEYSELFERMIREKLDIKWFTQIRPDTVANNPEMIRLAKASGLFGALVGFDSYDDEVLGGVEKVGSAEINRRAAEIFRQNEIVSFGVHIFGLPGETPRKYRKTFDLGRRNSDIYRMSYLSLIPGTPLYERYSREGKVVAYGEKQRVPYSHGIRGEDRDPDSHLRWYFFYWAWHTLSPWTFWDMLTSKGLYRRMKWRAYLTAFRYGFYFVLRLLRLKVL